MRRTLVVSCCVLVAWTSVGRAQAVRTENKLIPIATFVEKNLIGKTLEAKLSGTVEAAKTGSDFLRRTQFLNLVRTEDGGVSFDTTQVIQERLYSIDAAGKPILSTIRTKDRVNIMRYRLGRVESTGEVLGTRELVTSSTRNPTPAGATIQAELKADNELILTVSTPLYFDGVGGPNTLIPMSGKSVIKYTQKDGQLVAATTESSQEVDPKTLEKKGTAREVVIDERECSSLMLAAESAPTGEAKSEVDGLWDLNRYAENGKNLEDEVKLGYRVLRREGVQKITRGGEPFNARLFTVNPSKLPKQMDLMNDGNKTLAIYEISGNQMKVAIFSQAEKRKTERPADFQEEDGKTIAVYQRAEK